MAKKETNLIYRPKKRKVGKAKKRKNKGDSFKPYIGQGR